MKTCKFLDRLEEQPRFWTPEKFPQWLRKKLSRIDTASVPTLAVRVPFMCLPPVEIEPEHFDFVVIFDHPEKDATVHVGFQKQLRSR